MAQILQKNKQEQFLFSILDLDLILKYEVQS